MEHAKCEAEIKSYKRYCGGQFCDLGNTGLREAAQECEFKETGAIRPNASNLETNANFDGGLCAVPQAEPNVQKFFGDWIGVR